MVNIYTFIHFSIVPIRWIVCAVDHRVVAIVVVVLAVVDGAGVLVVGRCWVAF